MTLNLFDVPNGFILALLVLLTTIAGVATTFLQYYLTPQFGRVEHENAEKVLSRRTLLLMRKVVAASMLLVFPLIAKSSDPLYNDEFFHRNSLNKGSWCVLRLALQVGVGGSIFLFDSDAIFRFIASIGLSIIVVINMFSEINLADEITCIKKTLCSERQFGWSLNWLRFFVIRDLTTIMCCLYVLLLTIWIMPVFGLRRNRFWIPRKEHRQLRTMLNGGTDSSNNNV